MRVIFISSPFSEGDQRFNIERQNEAANVLMNEGYAPLAPLLLGDAMERMQSRTWEEWMECCLAWVAKCDAVLRLEGQSEGADLEVAEARRLGIPVYFSIEALTQNGGV